MKKLYIISIILSLLIITQYNLLSQIKGEPPKVFNPDTVFVFESPRPLVSEDASGDLMNQAWGFDLLFSNNGFGLGAFYQHYFAEDFFAFISLYYSYARNTDEFEYWDYNVGQYVVPDKVNRLYMLPVTIGIQRFIFTKELSNTLQPYVNLGLGPTVIMSTPYNIESFKALGYAKFYTRFGAFVGVGANIGANDKTLLGINARYYFIPFGGKGLESIKDLPIKDFGGLFLSLSIGVKY